MAVINELITSFGFKGNINPLKDFNKELTTVIPKMTKLSLGMVGVGSLFAKFLTSSLIADNPLVQFSQRTGESVKNIQALELASVKFGASLTSSLETTQNLSKALALARLKGNEAFGQFGLTIVDESGELKKTADILKDINKLFNSTNRVYGELADKRQKLIVLQTLGIKEDLLPLLIQTTAEYNKQIKISEQFTLSKEQVKSIKEFNNSLNETKSIVGQIASLVSADFGSSFKEITDTANGFLRTNKDIVLSMSDMVFKIGLVAGALGSLTILAKGLAFVFKGMFLPVTAGLLALEAFQNRKQLAADFKHTSRQIKRNLGMDVPKLEQTDTISKDAMDAMDAINLLNLKDRGAITGGDEKVKVIKQTNTFNISTDSPKIMSDVIENTVNKGIKLIQETSTRGGI